MKSFERDRIFIEKKYHNPEKPFDPYKRRLYHGWRCEKHTGLSINKIKRGLKEISEKYKEQERAIRKARAVEFVLDNTRIDINMHDYFPWIYTWGREIAKTTIDVWEKEMFNKTVPQIKRLYNKFNGSGAVAMWPDYDHVVPDWNSLIKLGFRGIIKRIKKYKSYHEKKGITTKQKALFEGMEIVYNSVVRLIRRMYELSLTKKGDKAPIIQRALKNLYQGAPTDTYEVMLLIYLYFIISDSISYYQVRSLGSGIDSTLLPYYENDLSTGKYSREQIREFLAYFFMQWSAIGNIMGQPMYIGGTDKNGNSKISQLTYDVIEVYSDMGIYDPKIQVKYNPQFPTDLLNKILSDIRNNKGAYVFCCEKGFEKAITSYGGTLEEARECDVRGCYETGVKANEVVTGTTYVNALKAVEYVFSNGFDKTLGKQVGIKIGQVEEFNTFELFFNAFIKQWDYLIDKSMEIVNTYEQYLSEINPSLFYSGTIENSLKKGVDAYQNGVKYNNSAILNCGFASAVDSLTAVKELVFDKKICTMQQLKDALDNNWVNYEKLMYVARNSSHKYGNGDKETDCLAKTLSSHFIKKVVGKPNSRGGVYKANMHSAMMFIWQGEKTLATPDGRRAGEEESKNAGPSVGMDRNGVTALLSSVVNLTPCEYTESCCIDVMLHPSAVTGVDGLKAMKTLIDYYYLNDGMSIQFNVFNAETLRDAQKNPQKYKNLQVRICGWNVLWNNLSLKEQESYIIRSENII